VHEEYEIFPSAIFHSGRPLSLHLGGGGGVRHESTNELQPRNPSMSAWGVLTAVGGNEPRTDMKN
jgi:hypothetical protein